MDILQTLYVAWELRDSKRRAQLEAAPWWLRVEGWSSALVERMMLGIAATHEAATNYVTASKVYGGVGGGARVDVGVELRISRTTDPHTGGKRAAHFAFLKMVMGVEGAMWFVMRGLADAQVCRWCRECLVWSWPKVCESWRSRF